MFLSVDRLNKKYEQLLEGVEEPENMGPLESTIRHLKKEIEKAESECLDLQKAWLSDQTQLVSRKSFQQDHIDRGLQVWCLCP